MIKFIKPNDVLNLRNIVLREGKLTLNECIFPTDNLTGAFHIGYFKDEELVCIASFHPQNYEEFTGTGYQLRGMATLEEYRGQGIGNQLLNFGLTYLKDLKTNYLWCNARKKALPFYQNMGFEIISPEFEVPGIGPHNVLYVKLA
jgi:predicted GNAT family N-acyltransferase